MKRRRKLSPGIAVAVLFFLVIWISWLRANGPSEPVSGDAGARDESGTGEAAYPGEIRYRDFEWGADAVTVSSAMMQHYTEGMTPDWSEAYSVMGLSSYQLGYMIDRYGGYSAGGHLTRELKLFFHYGHRDGSLSTAPEDSELYLIIMEFDVLDCEGAYDDLYGKLTSAYGEGATTVDSGRGSSAAAGRFRYTVTSTEWRGANDTGVMLTKSIENKGAGIGGAWDSYVALAYGKTDSVRTLLDLSREYREYTAAQEQAALAPDGNEDESTASEQD